MALAGVVLGALAFLASLLVLGRLHLLSLTLSALRDSVLSSGQGEVTFLRRQTELLQQQVLALTEPGAQARLHVQALPEEHPVKQATRRGPAPAPTPSRNPQQIEWDPRWSGPDAFEVLGEIKGPGE